jgi:hypothetical protein
MFLRHRCKVISQYLVDEKTLEPKVFDDWTDAQVEAHVWSYSDIEEVRRG